MSCQLISPEFEGIKTHAHGAVPFDDAQLMLSLAAGVALAALLLETSRTADARSQLLAVDFGRAFVAVGLLSLLSLVFYVRLAPHAGAEMSGHGAGAAAPGATVTPAASPAE